MGKGQSTAQAREIAPAAPAAPAAAEKPAPARVSVRISASPPEAKLFFDGEQLPMNPFIKVLSADTSEHEIRAEAEGHQVSTGKLVGDRDAEIMLKLERSPTDKKMTPRIRPREKRGPAPKPACDPHHRSQHQVPKLSACSLRPG
jgi:hypothetical protein